MWDVLARAPLGGRLLLPVLTVALLLGILALPTAASADPAVFSAQTPTPGSTTAQLRPTLSVEVVDPAGVRTDSASYMTLDGRTVRARATLLAGAGRVRFSFTPTTDLAPGSHRVTMSVLCWAGQRSTTSWSFTVGGPPTLGEPSPAPGSTVASKTPPISARVTAFSEPGITATMTVDGAMVPAYYDAASRTISYTPSSPLTNDQTHSVVLVAGNSYGVSAPLAWSFTVQIYPPMPPASDCVSCHTTYPGAHTQTDCDACHGYGSPIGGFYGPPDYHPEGEAALLLGGCTSCHGAGYPTVPDLHPLGNDPTHETTRLACTSASACHHHQTSLTTEHNRVGGTCLTCHGSADPVVQGAIVAGDTDCALCHAGKLDGAGNVVPHGFDPASHTASVGGDVLSGLWTAATATPAYPYSSSCGDCHLMMIFDEHAKPSSSSAAAGCDNCHPSPRDTLSPWAKTCSQGDCHPAGGATEPHTGMGAAHPASAASQLSWQSGGCGTGLTGTNCHNPPDLVVPHAALPGGGCTTCHSSGAVPALTPDPPQGNSCASVGCHYGWNDNTVTDFHHDVDGYACSGATGCHRVHGGMGF